ncbi:hypothetical protein BD779DRAFT_1680972 [Infundibulicybe gibba]|nr:hypothetical protein BD779DRAFT_1680972 [Infundibulicybe gibba]
MDENYSIEGAAQALEALAQARAGDTHAGIQLSELCTGDNWDAEFSAMSIGNPPVWHLIKRVDESNAANAGEMEELIVSVQGIIVGKNELPPFRSKIR